MWSGGEAGAREHELRTLSADECFDLLELGGIGRVGFASAAGIVMLPVNFAVTEKTVIVRTAPDTQLAVHANGPVSFEADHIDEARHEGWSVLVQGHAHMVTDERTVKRLEEWTDLQPWAPPPATCTFASRRTGSAGDASNPSEAVESWHGR